jgi:hypothetical protein
MESRPRQEEGTEDGSDVDLDYEDNESVDDDDDRGFYNLRRCTSTRLVSPLCLSLYPFIV